MPVKVTNKTVSVSNDELFKRRKFFDTIKVYIKYIGATLALFFTWLQLKNIPTPDISDNFSDTTLKITLALCYLSWIGGTLADIDDQEYVFIIAPNNGKLTRTAIGIILMFGVLFAILCLTTISLKYFSVALSIFLVLAKVGEIYTGRFVKSAIEKSKAQYKEAEDYFGLLSIAAVEKYVLGRWLWERFYVGSFIMILILISAFTSVSSVLAHRLQIQSANFITVSLVAIYTLAMEVWIWHYRLRRKSYLTILGELKEEYLSMNQTKK